MDCVDPLARDGMADHRESGVVCDLRSLLGWFPSSVQVVQKMRLLVDLGNFLFSLIT